LVLQPLLDQCLPELRHQAHLHHRQGTARPHAEPASNDRGCHPDRSNRVTSVLKDITRKMTQKEIAEAQNRVREWKPTKQPQ
jgi:hypothetical protein